MAFSPGRLQTALGECLSPLPEPPASICVASSGGLDSTALLVALVQLRDAGGLPPLRAIHVDHGLQAASGLWARHCASLAARLGVPLVAATVDARPAPGESPEAAARSARYAAFAAALAPGEVLLTAHHADDQLETVLLQWLRGGGLRAVAGMPALARFAGGWHARPLLSFDRDSIEAWARGERLEWIEDPSNLDARFDRNYLRLEVLPALRRRWPAAATTVGRVAAQAAEALDIEEGLALADLASVAEGEALSLAGLSALPDPRRRRVLRRWLRALGLPLPSAATLATLLRDATVAAGDRVPCVNWRGARVYRYRGRLHAVAADRFAVELPAGDWRAGEDFDLGAFGRLVLRPTMGQGLARSKLPAVLEVASRGDIERFRPAGSAHHRPLRKWLQEQGVLPWCRDHLPLILAGGELAAIGNLACAEAFRAGPGEESWIVEWPGRPRITEQDVLSAAGASRDPSAPFSVAGRGPFR